MLLLLQLVLFGRLSFITLSGYSKIVAIVLTMILRKMMIVILRMMMMIAMTAMILMILEVLYLCFCNTIILLIVLLLIRRIRSRVYCFSFHLRRGSPLRRVPFCWKCWLDVLWALHSKC